MPDKKDYDYTVMFWFRSSLTIEDLIRDRHNKHYLFELDGSVQCFIEDGVNINCLPQLPEGDDRYSEPIQLAQIPDIQQWMHLTYIVHSEEGYSTLRLDYPGGSLEMTLGYSSIN